MESLDKLGFGTPLLIEKKLGTVPIFLKIWDCPQFLSQIIGIGAFGGPADSGHKNRCSSGRYPIGGWRRT